MQTLTTSVLQNVSSAAAAAAAMSCVWTVAACMHAVWLVYASTLVHSRLTVCSASTTMTLTPQASMCTLVAALTLQYKMLSPGEPVSTAF
jgi:hypothetical protein